jgi:hypothetical protein
MVPASSMRSLCLMHASVPSIALAFVLFLCTSSVATVSATAYNFPIGYTQCYACQAGSFVSGEGSGQCTACGPGKYQDGQASSDCVECPEGACCLFHVC